jgi:uncharacterized protein
LGAGWAAAVDNRGGFHLKPANGEIIAASQGYQTKESAHKGIESVKTDAYDAKVVDLTEREPAHN